MPLIAYNVNLATDRLDVARKIASAVRHSSGGFRFVKAMGVELADRRIVQVSMNLTNFEKTPIFRVFELVKREAARYGVPVLESEIVGLVPAAALTAAAAWYLQLDELQRRPDTREQAPVASLVCLLPSASAFAFPFRAHRRAAERDAEAAHLPVEVAALDAEHVSRPRDVAIECRQGVLRMYSRSQRRAPRTAGAAASIAAGAGATPPRSRNDRSAARHHVARHHDHQPLDHVAQLAHVAGPAVGPTAA